MYSQDGQARATVNNSGEGWKGVATSSGKLGSFTPGRATCQGLC